jgi:hypothetical protein
MATTEPAFDKQEQYDRIQDGLMPGESIVAVYDCIGAGTGFVGLTDRRVILQDNSFMGEGGAHERAVQPRAGRVVRLQQEHARQVILIQRGRDHDWRPAA